MAFSESFQFGNSTFMNIENQVQHAINDNQENSYNNEDKENLAMEIIKDSPTKIEHNTHLSKSRCSIIRSRRFRRSKSDSILQSPKVKTERENGYTEFFCSAFTCSFKEEARAEEQDVALIEQHKISQDKNEIDLKQEILDNPIFSEDINALLDSEILSTFTMSHKELDSATTAAKNVIKAEQSVEEKPLLDCTAFLEPCPDLVAKKHIEQLLEESHQVLVKSNQLQNINNSLNKTKQLRESSFQKSINKSSKTSSSQSINLDDLKSISAWNLPVSVQLEYEKKGVINMFDWQVACLSNNKVLFEHSNLVYSAPTSAGKTLVSEILLLKTIFERGKKVLVILPFISVVREKMFYLQDLLTPAGYRVEGFFGGYTPPGGFNSIDVAICTIEKANSIINKLLEQRQLETIGCVVVDEVHLISDAGRGYILELLLAKIMYMSRKYALQIQIITMSATLANVQLLQKWLQAELYTTDFRPVMLQEMIKVGTKIYDREMCLLRDVHSNIIDEEPLLPLANDADHVAQLCLETIFQGCSVVVFCPSKDWCENLAKQLAATIHALGKSNQKWADRLRLHIKRDALEEVKRQLRDIPTGLDTVLDKTVTFGCAFHHAGLTTEERDIIEASFKSCALKIIVATSTLSSGVNLPARRVLIRTPLFGGKQMSSLTYKQMIGRAGRTGKDTLGESILICTESNARIGRDLISAELQPIKSCLQLDSSTHLKRALLEVISADVANTFQEIEDFFNCTLLSIEKQLNEMEEAVIKREENSCSSEELTNEKYLQEALDFLIEYEFVHLQQHEETKEHIYVATRLGNACLASSMPPSDGLLLFVELQKARRSFVLESELHAVYLVTPYSVCYQLNDLDWLFYLDLWEKLTPTMRKVGELVGVKESFLVRAMRGNNKLDYNLLQIHKRFYTALALQELVNEIPINVVTQKYKCTRGMLQGLQQMSSTFAGIVTAFCNSLQWSTLALIVSQFKERLYFGIHRDLIDLMRLPDLSQKRARVLYDAGIETLVDLAHTDVLIVEKILYNALSFDSAKQLEHENAYETKKRNMERIFFITGRKGLTVAEGAKLLIEEARLFVQHELGVENIKWTTKEKESSAQKEELHMSVEKENKINAKEISNEKSQCLKVAKVKIEKETERQTEKRSSNECELSTEIAAKKLLKDQHEVLQEITNISVKSENKSDDEQLSRDIKNATKTLMLGQPRMSSNNVDLRTDELPSTSKEALKIIRLQKVRELKRATQLKTSEILSENESKIDTKKVKIEKTENKLPLNKELFVKPSSALTVRRSPRNHLERSTQNSKITSIALDTQLLEGKELFAHNSAAIKTLNDVGKATEEIVDDEIPSSQQFADYPDAGSTAARNSPRTPHTSRFMRSLRRTQRKATPKPEISPEAQTPIVEQLTSCSLEFSDFALENSLIKPAVLLNASHILSCSDNETTALSFKSLDIVDICGNKTLFHSAVQEILNTKRLGFSLGLQQHHTKKVPIIGAKLLKNSAPIESEEEQIIFQYDEDTYVAGIAFGMSNNIIYYMDMQNTCSCKVISSHKCELLSRLFNSKEHTLLICDAKEQLKIVLTIVPSLKKIEVNVEDPKVANWLLQPDKVLSYPQMTQQFSPECSSLVKLCGTGRGYISYGLDAESAIYAKVRASIEACVNDHILRGQIENLKRIGNGELYKFFKEIEMPVQLSLCYMELCGFPVSEAALGNLLKDMLDICKQIEAKVFDLHGSRFNFASATAVGKVLGLHRKTNGKFSTSKQILEKIDSPIAQLIILQRKISATLTKNIQPLMKCIKKDRIHGQSITFTATGRISMVEPNLQNVARCFEVNLDKGKKCTISCRDAFFPIIKSNCLISADFCQLEMRILAHLSQDITLLKVMKTQEDLFTAIAARWNRIPASEVSMELRNGTKQICYGIVYGMGMRSLAESLKCSEDEAHLLYEQFHATYPGIRSYTNKVVRFARSSGYVETITGRRRYLENINSSEAHIKTQAERQAVNSTIQGSAADIAKTAILRMEKNIIKYCQKLTLDPDNVRFVLHMHDELIFEAPSDKARKVAKVLSLTMENCIKLSVPLRVKLKIGRTWAQLIEVKL